MFTPRYFAPRYFAPRYFAEFGLTPPPVVLGAIRVLVNGTERTDYLYYAQSIRWNLMRGNRGAASLPLLVEPGDPFAPQVGESIEIYDPMTTRVWSGHVTAVKVNWIGEDGWHFYTLTCVSLEALFDTTNFDKLEYASAVGPLTPPFTAGDIVTDLWTRSGIIAVGLGTISDGPEVSALQVSNCAQGFNDLALLAGFVWYVDPLDNLLYFHAPGARAAAWTVVSEDVLFETLDWNQSDADFRDRQVLQLPGVAQSPITATFLGDNVTTAFTLPSVPGYLVSVTVLPMGKGGSTIVWNPGGDTVTVTPALPTGASLVVQYADASGQLTANAVAPAPGIGSKTARYTKTRTFTEAGGLQEATAMLARYSMLPSTLSMSVDKPGIGIARAVTFDLDFPVEAGSLINGVWLVMELDAVIIPGLDMREEPFGHFRYTVRMVNTAATAIFHGDGATTTFLLPEIPSAVRRITVTNTTALTVTAWAGGTNQITATPALPDGAGVVVDYIGAQTPDVPSFVNTWENMPGGGTGVGDAQLATASPIDAPVDPDAVAVFTRTLTLRDLAVADDIAPHTPVYHDGIAYRLLGVLSKAILSDLTVRINKEGVELITVTVPSATMVDEVLEWSLAQGSPAILGPFFDKEVLTADILESDGSTAVNGVAQFTVEWTRE